MFTSTKDMWSGCPIIFTFGADIERSLGPMGLGDDGILDAADACVSAKSLNNQILKQHIMKHIKPMCLLFYKIHFHQLLNKKKTTSLKPKSTYQSPCNSSS